MQIAVKEGALTDFVHYSIPLFLVGILIDLLISLAKPSSKHKRSYRINDSINSLSCGVMSELVKVHARWIVLLPYTYVYKEFAIYRVPFDSVWAWILVFLGVDLAYYCM